MSEISSLFEYDLATAVVQKVCVCFCFVLRKKDLLDYSRVHSMGLQNLQLCTGLDRFKG